MSKFRVGVIGAGAIAQACHIPGYAKAENCELAAIADPVQRCLDEVKSKGYNFARTYSDYRQMLKKEQLDVVSICTPNSVHRPAAIATMEAGVKDILLEKPVATTMAEAFAIKKVAAKRKTRIMVGFTHRFNDLNIGARAAVLDGRLGEPYMARVRFAHMGPIPGWAKTDWFYKPKLAGGGAMLDMAIHAIDLLQWYLGPITAVQAKVATLRKKIAVDDNAVMLMEFGGRCLAYIEAGWTSKSGYCGVELMGDNGAITVDYSTGTSTLIQGVRKPSGESYKEETVLAQKPKPAWRCEMEYFTANLGKKSPFCIDLDAGIAALAVALAAYQSSKTGKRVLIAALVKGGARKLANA
jgi:predicted dehydrogenase